MGVGAVQMASAAGLRVFGTAGSERGRALAREQGAHEVFDHTAPGYEKDIVAKTGGRGIDLIIEMLANVNLVKDLDLIAKRGRIVIVGNRGALELNPRAIMGKDATIVGFTNFNVLPGELATAHAAIVAGMERSGYKPQVGKEMPLADAPRAHEDVLKPGAYGKIVLIPVAVLRSFALASGRHDSRSRPCRTGYRSPGVLLWPFTWLGQRESRG